MESIKVVLDNLKSALNCPVCSETFKGSIFLCDDGHSICEGCMGNLWKVESKSCPVCKKVTRNKRNHTLENILESGIDKLDLENLKMDFGINNLAFEKEINEIISSIGYKNRDIAGFLLTVTRFGITIDNTMSELKKSLEEAVEENQTLSANLQVIEKERDSWKSTFEHQIDTSKQLEKKIQNKETELKSVRGKYNDTRQTCEKLRFDLQELKVKNSTLNTKLANLKISHASVIKESKTTFTNDFAWTTVGKGGRYIKNDS